MVDLSTSPAITFRHLRLSWPNLSLRPLAATLLAMSRSIGEAFAMAYVDPYANRCRTAKIMPADDLDGRDADW